MFWGLLYIFSVFILSIFTVTLTVVFAEISVTTYYETEYRDKDIYYILHGQSVTLVCGYGLTEEQVYDVSWYKSEGDTEVLLFSKAVLPGNEVKGTDLEDRDVSWTYTNTSHRLTILQVNILTDAIRYRCFAENQQGVTGGAFLDLNNKIYKAPDSVSLQHIGSVIEGTTAVVQCAVPSIYPGYEETEFRVIVGEEHYVAGAESQRLDNNGLTYTVTHEETILFHRSQHGNRVTCEVTWNEAPIEVIRASNSEDLDIYFEATGLTLTGVPSDSVVENTEVIVVCTSNEGNPTPTVRWYKDGQTLPVNTNLEAVTDIQIDGQYNSKYVESTLKVQVDRSLNGVEYRCTVVDTTVDHTFTLDVTFPPNIQVIQDPQDFPSEGSVLFLSCGVTGGNPEVKYYSWRFKPRYDVTSDISCDTKRELQFDSVQYKQAGVYSCEVDNGAGVQIASKEVLVHFAPRDVSLSGEKFTYAVINGYASLNCTVIAYPVITSNEVTVRLDGNTIVSPPLIVTALDDRTDAVLIQLMFDSVSANDFGIYEVSLSNGVTDDVDIELSLLPHGVPEAPHSLMFESVTAVSVTLSWMSGLNGGSVQTFTVYYRKDGDSKISYRQGIGDNGENIQHKISGLDPSTKYFFQVQSRNENGISNSQSEIEISTIEKPSVEGQLSLMIYKDLGILEWGTVSGIYNNTYVESCEPGNQHCSIVLNVTRECHNFFVLKSNYIEHEFNFVIYQDADVVSTQRFIVMDNRDTENTGNCKGLAVGLGVVTGLLLLFIIVTITMLYRKGALEMCSQKTRESNKEGNSAATYENVTSEQKGGQYEMTQPVESRVPAEYVDLKHVTYEGME